MLGDRFHDPRDADRDAGPVASTPRNVEAVFRRIRRPVTSDVPNFKPSIDFLHGLGRYEETRRQLRAEREKECSDFLALDKSQGSRVRRLSVSMHDLTSKSPASTPHLTSGREADARSRLSEKRLQHEKYSEELRQQIEEKRLLNQEEEKRLQEQDDRMHIKLQKDRSNLKLEYETEMAKMRIKSRSQPDIRQPVTATSHPPTSRKQVRSPSYVFVNKKTPVTRTRATASARFEDKMPQSTTISTQTGDSLMEDMTGPTSGRYVGMIQTPRPEPHPRVSKSLMKGNEMRFTPVKQKLKESQDKMLLRLASLTHNQNNSSIKK